MKKTVFIILVVLLFCFISAACAEVPIDAKHFPDPVLSDYLSTSMYNRDEDQFLSDEEIARITELRLSYRGLTDLTGIEYFTHLEKLDCSSNNLKAFDLSKNQALTELNCRNNINLLVMHAQGFIDHLSTHFLELNSVEIVSCLCVNSCDSIFFHL